MIIFFLFSWYCNECWDRFEETERLNRIRTGQLLPEDRVLWYSSSVKPAKLFDQDQHIFTSSDDWLEVDTYGLVIEFHHDDCESEDPRIWKKGDDFVPQMHAVGESAIIKTLPWRVVVEGDVILAGTGGKIIMTDPQATRANHPGTPPSTSSHEHPVSVLTDFHRILISTSPPLNWAPFLDPVCEIKRAKFLLVLAEKKLKKEIEAKEHEAREEQKRKQQVEVAAKKKELLELAVKRAQGKKPLSRKVDRLNSVRKKVEAWKAKAEGVERFIVLASFAKLIPSIGTEIPKPGNSSAPKILNSDSHRVTAKNSRSPGRGNSSQSPRRGNLSAPRKSISPKRFGSPESENKSLTSAEPLTPNEPPEKRRKVAKLGMPIRDSRR